MESFDLYRDIAERTNGDIYIGVVGPVRTGKSTFISRMMDQMVTPLIDNPHKRMRVIDELPQSGSGRTIMTTQPKFVPDEAVEVSLSDSATANVRLVDCVGYLIPGALGTSEGEAARMVHTPWYDEDIPFEDAAEIGTRKVINDHSTLGLVVTTDGSFTELPRSAYTEAEERVVRELKALHKPFVVVLNSALPSRPETQQLKQLLEAKYSVPVSAVDVKNMTTDDISELLNSLLMAFPMREFRIELPNWTQALDEKHWLLQSLLETAGAAEMESPLMRDQAAFASAISKNEYADPALPVSAKLGEGSVTYQLPLKEGLFNKILGEEAGTEIRGDAHLLSLLKDLVYAKKEYDRIADALSAVRQTGYGLVVPTLSELTLQQPEIVKQGNRFGVRLKASAPSLHLIRTDITTEVTPVVGTEQQSEELVQYLLSEFEQNPEQIWETNFFGKSLHDMVREGLSTKLSNMPVDAQEKVQDTLTKIVNEGSGGMICILL
ncbi:MAG: stage IV sporulation protein A [Oscillospiraceae bacterium]|jgi:stage IV sporulation protein A|nr:stage IV sporulation protein A [Oscillospiraceae bacterium]